jgi:hypothetical protein
MAFDVDGARKAGYSDAEIADHLGSAVKFDTAAARKAGYSDAELIGHLRPKLESFRAPPTERDELLSSTPMRVARGGKDAIDGAAQLAARIPGAELVNKAADAVGGALNRNVFNKIGLPGDFAGEVLGIRGATPEQLRQDLVSAEAEYKQAREATGQTGVDGARVIGNIISPVNMTLGRFIPGGGSTLKAIAGKSALTGAAGGATQPVLSERFAAAKAGQVGFGAVAGAAGGVAIDKLVRGAGNLWAQVREMPAAQRVLAGFGSGKAALPPDAMADQLIAKSAADQGIRMADIPKEILDDVRGQVKAALGSGKSLDGKALLRQAEGRAVLGDDAALLRGQVTRDPQQFTRDMNASKINGAGAPLADRLNLQNVRFIEKVAKMGAKEAPDAYDAGTAAINSLQAYDDKLSAGVREAYNKFRSASGSTVDVPLPPLAQRLGEVVEKYGAENVPGAVRAKLESYGLGGMKQTKVFDLLEADKLIKIINANIDPLKGPQSAALGELRAGLNEAIELAVKNGDEAAGPSADLLREALKTAKSRFSLHEQLPALADAVKNPKAKEKFVRDYITSKSASIDTVDLLTRTLDGKTLDAVRKNVLAEILESAAPGARRGSDSAKFSQDAYNRALESIGDRKLMALFGEEATAQLKQVGRVAEWAQKQPSGSAVNNSNTASAVFNLLQGITSKAGALPAVNILRDSARQFSDERAVGAALKATVPAVKPQMTPDELAAARRLIPILSGAAGPGAISASR